MSINWKRTKYKDISVSDTGLVRNDPRFRYFTPAANSRGYLIVTLHIDKVQLPVYVHRLVCEAFHGISDLTVDHIDCNKLNNRADNLRWISIEHNAGRANQGLANNRATLTFEQVNQVRAKEFTNTVTELAREFKVSLHCIGSILKRRTRTIS